MIGSGLKKLAQEHGMKVAKGVAYGSFRGYGATFSEGKGYKQIVLTTKFPEPEKQNALQAKLNGRNISKELRVRSLSFAPDGICVVFNDNPGTMKKITEFLDWFMPMLDEAGAQRSHICTECGMPITGGCWKLIDGTAFYMHEACAERRLRAISEEEQARKDADDGTYLKGALGAFAGAALGAVVWALVLFAGYVASLVGLLIGWLADQGYKLLHGKQGKAKIIILILAIVFGVVLGTVASEVLYLAAEIGKGETILTYADIPMVLMFALEDPEAMQILVSNILQGLLFAALGVVYLLMQANKDVSGVKVEHLE